MSYYEKIQSIDAQIKALNEQRDKYQNAIYASCSHPDADRENVGYEDSDGYGRDSWVVTGWKCNVCGFKHRGKR